MAGRRAENWWQLMELAAASDNRARRIKLRRQRLRISRRETDVFEDLTEELFSKKYRLGKDAVRRLAEDVVPLLPRERRRDALSGMLKILVTLSFFATGSYQTLVGESRNHNVSQSSVCRAVCQVTRALNHATVYRKYVVWPQTARERCRVKTKFYEKFGMPGVLGCIDGTHVAIIRPHINEERYINRKGYHSLNVMIICDADMRILCADPSSPGSSHDSTIWRSHPLSQHMDDLYENGDHSFLLGDSGYALRRTMITPILNTVEGTAEHYFYNKQVLVRNTVERCIGLLKARFRCLLVARALHYAPITAGKIVNACTVLHNLAIDSNAPLPEEELPTDEIEQNMMNEVDEEAEATEPARGANAALLQGRALQQALVDRLWRDRQRDH